MGLLAPLYFAGIVLVGLPILFHLIRRQPQGKQAFSSLIFLQPSPPRLTKRSRIDNLLLLILRAAAVALLAIAFARPFLNHLMASDKVPSHGRKIALLIDQSASMRRADLWDQAQKKADEFLKTVTPADQVALFFFDDQVHPALGFDQWNKAEPSERVKLMELQLASARPTYAGTRLGDALGNVAGQLSEIDPANRAADTMPRMIELISDLQKGGNAEALQGHEWPANVVLKVEPVAVSADKKTNASLQWVTQTTEEGTNDDRLRVWVNNESGSVKDQFTLTWADKDGPIPGADPLRVYVPAGHKEIVRVPWPQVPAATAPAARGVQQRGPAGAEVRMAPLRTADRLVLGGDDFDFDNTLFVVPPRVDTFKVLYLGDDAANNVEGMLYYLASALGDTSRRQATLITRRHDVVPEDADFDARLVVVGDDPNDATVAKLEKCVENGGNVLWVMKDAQSAGAIGKVLGMEGVEAREANTNFSLISDVDTTHPLFAPFAEARFGDFTKIHFWHHRIVELPQGDAAAARVNVLARFDDQSPFVLEKGIGKGWLRVLTSGWSPADSQFALSTKFVPLMEGFLKRRDAVAIASQYGVHEPVALPPPTNNTDAAVRAMVMPDGKRIEFGVAATTFEGTDLPGIYQLEINGGRAPIAVNLPSGESDTAALAPEDLAQWGAKMGAPPKTAADRTAERHRQSEDLEKQQKLWRWIILCVLGLLGIETLLAGRLARRATLQGAAT